MAFPERGTRPTPSHYQSDSERWKPEPQPQPTREIIRYVPMSDDVNERAWRRAKMIMANNQNHINVLDQLERIKQLVVSGHPNGEGL